MVGVDPKDLGMEGLSANISRSESPTSVDGADY